jgi:integrase
MAERLYKRRNTWWGWYYEANGKRISRSTRCRDRRAAEAVVREWERHAADSTYGASDSATLREALDRFLIDRRNKGRAEATLSSYRAKAGHVLRLLGGELKVARVDARMVDEYVDTRLNEGAARHTIHKELVALRGTLKVAKRRGDFKGDIAAVMPEGFSSGYKPRKRFLTGDEAPCLLAELAPDRAARVAFSIATGARLSEAAQAMRKDIDWLRRTVHLRGTKTEAAARTVPIVGASVDLLEYAERYAEGSAGHLFRPWANMSRDLAAACERASKSALAAHLASTNQSYAALSEAEQSALQAEFAFPRVSSNDLRRTYGTWLRQHGAEPHLIGVALGHEDSRMAERVYAAMPSASIGPILAERVGDNWALAANDRNSGCPASHEDPKTEASMTLVPRPRDAAPMRGFLNLIRIPKAR